MKVLSMDYSRYWIVHIVAAVPKLLSGPRNMTSSGLKSESIYNEASRSKAIISGGGQEYSVDL
jgi:hypothetical protein